MNLLSWSKILAYCLIMLLVPTAAFSQSSAKSAPKYDKTKEVKLKGTVTEVKETGGSNPVVLLVKTGENSIATVQLAPSDYLKEIDCWVKAGDQVEVTGAKVPDSPNEILAREVVFGNNTMVLRDDKGTPIWELWKPAKSGG